MKRWILAFRVEPPLCTVMVRFGSTVFDGWYSRFQREWFGVLPGGTMERIAEPEMLFVTEDYAREHPAKILRAKEKSFRVRQSKRPVQLLLFDS
jgi:hypothetical protein